MFLHINIQEQRNNERTLHVFVGQNNLRQEAIGSLLAMVALCHSWQPRKEFLRSRQTLTVCSTELQSKTQAEKKNHTQNIR